VTKIRSCLAGAPWILRRTAIRAEPLSARSADSQRPLGLDRYHCLEERKPIGPFFGSAYFFTVLRRPDKNPEHSTLNNKIYVIDV
jgi:hypothetical protein